jgi:hypothetical protein
VTPQSGSKPLRGSHWGRVVHGVINTLQ